MFRTSRLLLALVALVNGSLLAAERADGLSLPADPRLWINSGPISFDALKGKAAVLWFYEEQCPKCREKWPELLALSKKLEGQPIIFIAVNSGNSRGEVEQYVRSNKITWPVIVDPTREFEQALGLK